MILNNSNMDFIGLSPCSGGRHNQKFINEIKLLP